MLHYRVVSYVGVAIAIFVCTFAVMNILDWYNDIGDWCEAGAKPAFCVREWVSAFSGWVAIFVAFPTIYYLQQQISEQKKQTDFLVGEALPTLDSVQDLDDPEEIVLRIVNWNRRGIIVKSIEIDGVTGTCAVMDYKVNDQPKQIGNAAPFIRGWENRSIGPSTMQFKISAEAEEVILSEFPLHTKIHVDFLLIGDMHVVKRLTCNLHPLPYS